MEELAQTERQFDEVMSSLKALLVSRLSEIEKTISSYRIESEKLENIRNVYHIDRSIGFNIFTSISDIYHRENLHSDILRLILDPETDTIGNRENLDSFVSILHALNGQLAFEPFSANVSSIREMGRIDILIYDEKQAIIIENKINNAPDMDNQLARYYQYVNKEKNLDVVAIVYLSLDEKKFPSLHFEDSDPSIIKEIERKLVRLPALESGGKLDYAHGFLDRCVEIAKNETARVYLKHYSDLVKYLGGNVMSKETDKKILEKIYSSEESLSAVRDIVEVWNQKSKIIPELLKDALVKELRFQPYEGYTEAICKAINESIALGFHDELSFGFVVLPNKRIGNYKDKLVGILGNAAFDDQCFSPVMLDDPHWVYRTLNFESMTGSVSERTKYVTEKMSLLEEKTKKELES